MNKRKLTAIISACSAVGLAIPVASVSCSQAAQATQDNDVADANPTAPFTAGTYVTITFTTTDPSVTIIGNPRSRILQGSPFGTALAPKVVKEGYHFVCWTKTVAGEEVKVPSTEIVNDALEVHPLMAIDATNIAIRGEKTQFSTINITGSASPGESVLDYHVVVNPDTPQESEITDKDAVDWSVVNPDTELETPYATITETSLADESFATISTTYVREDTIVWVRATCEIEGVLLQAKLPVTIKPPYELGWNASGELERDLPAELGNTPIWVPYPYDQPTLWLGITLDSLYDAPEDGAEVATPVIGYSWMNNASVQSTIQRDTFAPWYFYFGRTFGVDQKGETCEIGDYFLRNCSAFDAIMYANFAPIKAIGNSFMDGCTEFNTSFSDMFNADGSNGAISRLSEIGDEFMADCSSFNQNEINDNFTYVNHIGDAFMLGCSSFVGNVALNHTYIIDDFFMYGSGIRTITLGSFVGHVGNNFLTNCDNLESVTINCTPWVFDTTETLNGGTLTTTISRIESGKNPVLIQAANSEELDAFLLQFPNFAIESATSNLYRELSHTNEIIDIPEPGTQEYKDMFEPVAVCNPAANAATFTATFKGFHLRSSTPIGTLTAQFTDLNSTGFFKSTATINITSETEAEKTFDIVVNTNDAVCQNSLGYNVRLQIKDDNVPIFSSDSFKVIVIKPTTYTVIEDYTLTSDGASPVLNLAFNFSNPSGCTQTAKHLKVIPLSSGIVGEEFGYSEPTPDRNPTFSVRFKNADGGAIAPGTYYFSFELYDGNIRTRMGIFDKLATVTNVPIVITSTAKVDADIGSLFLDTSSSGQRYYHYSQYGGYYWLVNVPNKDAEHLKFDITASDEGLHFDRAEIVWHTVASFRINFWLTDSPTSGSHQFYIKISATDASGQWVQLLDRTESVSY